MAKSNMRLIYIIAMAGQATVSVHMGLDDYRSRSSSNNTFNPNGKQTVSHA